MRRIPIIIFRSNLNYSRRYFPSVGRLIFLTGICYLGVSMFTFFFKIRKYSYGLAECTFDKPGRKLSLQVRIFLEQSAKKIMNLVSLGKNFLPKRSPGEVGCSFDITAENFSFKIRKLFAQCQKENIAALLRVMLM